MEQTDTTPTAPVRKNNGALKTIGIIVALLALVGVLFAMNLANDAAAPAGVAHDHDGDGKPDHGDDSH